MAQHTEIGWPLENSYAQLPAVLFAAAKPAVAAAPQLVILNERLAAELGLDLADLPRPVLADLFAGQNLPGAFRPIAQAYAGHQFGGFTMLGDGRAILLGELRMRSGQLVDLQLKGAGQTAYSRRGDGLAALGPMLREYVISEAMHALGIPTTRSLAVVATGGPVYRESVRKGAILTRVAASHIRVGTFEFLASRRDEASLRALADYAIERHYPELVAIPEAPERYLGFLRAVIARQAALIARWQLVGFVHGVMNTDNMAISGETIDYGPCAFMNAYHPDTVFSSIDHAGRYAYGNQPAIAQWNLARFAEALLPILDADEKQAIAVASAALNEYPGVFEQHWLAGMRQKLGLQTALAGDVELIRSLLEWMEQSRADFTNTFRTLSAAAAPTCEDDALQTAIRVWHARWLHRLQQEERPISAVGANMQAVNPAVIPRNHRVEEALEAAENRDNLSVLNRLLGVLATPYQALADAETFREPPSDDCDYKTFCGT